MKLKKSNIFITIGLVLIGAALLLVLYNINQARQAQIASKKALNELSSQISLSLENNINSKTADNQPVYQSHRQMDMPKININGEYYVGILKIPALGLELPVKGDFSYKGLLSAPCMYYGSVYTDNMVVAAHNYYSHFGRLKSLKIGDEVSFTDGDGNVFTYAVGEIEQLRGSQVEEMKSGFRELTLFTCTPCGKARVTVRLELNKTEK